VLKATIIKKKNYFVTNNIEPGKILKKSKNFLDVKCGEGVIRILDIAGNNISKINKYL
jgi:methionyl-tRNA formyltransferase